MRMYPDFQMKIRQRLDAVFWAVRLSNGMQGHCKNRFRYRGIPLNQCTEKNIACTGTVSADAICFHLEIGITF